MYTLGHYCIQAGISEPPEVMFKIGIRECYRPTSGQVQDLSHCMQHERFGLFNDAGVGKTLPMQAAMILYTAGYGNRGLVVMPPTLIGQFMESLHHPEKSYFIGLSDHCDIQAFQGTKKKKAQLWSQWVGGKFPDCLVMGYSVFSDMHPLKPIKSKVVTNSTTGKSFIRPAVRPLRQHPLKVHGFNVLFFDESHALKNPGSGVSKKVWAYVAATEGDYALGLFTGTPVPNTPEDAFGTIKLLTPDAYPTKRRFDKEHVVLNMNSQFRQILGFINLEKLNDVLMSKARRVTKQEAVKDLPPMIPEVLEVTLAPKHYHQYKTLMRTRVLELDGEFIDATQQSKLRQIALRMITLPEKFLDIQVKNEPLAALTDKVAEINPFVNKIIVFAFFTETIQFLEENFSQLNPAVINGKSGDKESARVKFTSDDSCRMIIINWISGGSGLNLQVSNNIIFYETPSVPSHVLQAIARSHRRGQDKPVYVWFLRVLKTLAAKSLKQLLDKDIQVNEVVKDKHKMLKELLGE